MEVNDQFKKDILKFGKRISIKLTIGEIVYENEKILSCTRSFNGDLFKSYMSYIDVEMKDSIDIRDKEMTVEFGVKYDSEVPYEYVNWGTFFVDNESIEKSIDKNTTKFTAYDGMLKACTDYVDLGLAYPVTIKEFLITICNHLGYTLATETFTNSDKLITEEKFLNTGTWTFRDVLDQIAGVAGGIILIKGTYLYIKYPTDIDYVIDKHNLKSLSMLEKWGPVNSLVLSLMPQNDNYYKRDTESFLLNGLTEIKIANNELMNKERELFVDDLFSRIAGFYFYPFELESFGYGFFEPLDVVTIKDLDGKEYQTVILNDTVEVTTGVNEKINSSMPENAVTDYSKATSSEKMLYKTILEVDKQNQKITALVEKQEDLEDEFSSLEMGYDQIKAQVERSNENIYKFETGSGNIFDNCYQLIMKDSTDSEKVMSTDMPLGINRDYLTNKDICISADIYVRDGIIGSLGGYCGAEFDIGYADGTKETYSIRFYPGQISFQYPFSDEANSFDKRIYAHYRLPDKEIRSVSNLRIIINLNAEKAVVSNPKVEFGTYPTGFNFDMNYMRDNIVTLNRDYTQIVQNIDSLSLQAISLTDEITTIKGDVSTVQTRLQSTELKLEPTNILMAVNEKIGADGELYTTKFVLDKKGVHISGGGLDISNNAGTKVLYADNNGNLTLKNITAENATFSGTIKSSNITGSTITGGTVSGATIKSESGTTAVSISGGRLELRYADTSVGYIGTNKINSTTHYGLVFDLEYDGSYMAWANRDGNKYATKMMYVAKGFSENSTNYIADRLYLGCDLDMRNYTLRNVNFENGGVTGTLDFVRVASVGSDGLVHTWANGCRMEFKNGILVSAAF